MAKLTKGDVALLHGDAERRLIRELSALVVIGSHLVAEEAVFDWVRQLS